MLVKVKEEQAEVLRELEVQTYQETFGPYIKAEDMQDYFTHELSLEQIQKDLAQVESETYFALNEKEKIVGLLKFNWGQAQTEPVEAEHSMENAFEVHRIYVLKSHQGQGFGKEMFDFAMQEATKRKFSWVWLGVWEHNHPAQKFYQSLGFVKTDEHDFYMGNERHTDYTMTKQLKEST